MLTDCVVIYTVFLFYLKFSFAALLTCFSSSIPLSVNSETCGIDYNRDFNGFHSALEDLERVILVDGKSKFKQINTQIANLVVR